MTLTKRRSQIKQAITAMIQECCKFVDQIQDKERKLQLIDTLRTVTAGKVNHPLHICRSKKLIFQSLINLLDLC